MKKALLVIYVLLASILLVSCEDLISSILDKTDKDLGLETIVSVVMDIEEPENKTMKIVTSANSEITLEGFTVKTSIDQKGLVKGDVSYIETDLTTDMLGFKNKVNTIVYQNNNKITTIVTDSDGEKEIETYEKEELEEFLNDYFDLLLEPEDIKNIFDEKLLESKFDDLEISYKSKRLKVKIELNDSNIEKLDIDNFNKIKDFFGESMKLIEDLLKEDVTFSYIIEFEAYDKVLESINVKVDIESESMITKSNSFITYTFDSVPTLEN